MANRFFKIPIRFKDKKSYYKNIRYPEVPLRINDIYIITKDGDRLDLLAYQFYGKSNLWWYIAAANNINTMNLEPGTSLRIPPLTGASKGMIR